MLIKADRTAADIGPIIEFTDHRRGARKATVERWVLSEVIVLADRAIPFGVRLTAAGVADRRHVAAGGGMHTKPLPWKAQRDGWIVGFHRPAAAWGRSG